VRLPDRLDRRTRRLNDHEPVPRGVVVYWMRTAVRAHENPALDVAIHLANDAGVPVFVYHALSERYPYASDRHHRFILEGARDVAAALEARGIATAFHLERPGHRGPHLLTLAESATAIVTEDMPVDPLRRWTRALADQVAIPVFAVDTATVVPMRVVGKGADRAFAYRKRIEPHLDRETAPWDEVEPLHSDVPDLPYTPVDLSQDLGDLIAACAIDHTVPPVADTVGGTTAGMERWRAFRDSGLKTYHKDRNDPVRQGVSRMSAYFHYGMVAPTAIAREALGIGGPGARKYLDELIVWRELAYTWCLFARHHDTLDALPKWARETLLAHASDARDFLPGLERLELGETGDPVWDLAQRSLLRNGELHNNVRMTWGKALIPWSPDPTTALRRVIDLNHRYALDGRDPASYGGLLWCFGRFDRPFQENPVWGTVRSRSTKTHRKRIDLERWTDQLDRTPTLRIAIVGAGLAGSFAGRILQAHGHEVVLFDKGRGAGGRLSARRSDGGRLIHGAPTIHLDDPRLARWVEGWTETDVIRSVGDAFTGDPPNTLIKHLQAPNEVHFGARVTAVAHDGAHWSVHIDDDAHAGFDALIVTAPAPQARALLPDDPLAAPLDDVRYAPCWVGLATFPEPITPVADGPVERVAGDGRAWTLHFDRSFSEAHLEDDRDTLCGHVRDWLQAHDLPDPLTLTAHRWRYARVLDGLDTDVLHDADRRLVLAGDAFAGGDAAGALSSGAAAAGRLLGRPR
jgi:hypothetical protein